MTLEHVVVEGLEAFRAALSKATHSRKIVLFTGSHVQGKSWCPDCVTAEPVIDSVLSSLSDADVTFITCFVGQRDYWKDPACPFRTESDLKLNCVPTLLEHGTKKRLVDDQVANAHMVKDMILDE